MKSLLDALSEDYPTTDIGRSLSELFAGCTGPPLLEVKTSDDELLFEFFVDGDVIKDDDIPEIGASAVGIARDAGDWLLCCRIVEEDISFFVLNTDEGHVVAEFNSVTALRSCSNWVGG